MVDALVLEASVERRRSSSLLWGTKKSRCSIVVVQQPPNLLVGVRFSPPRPLTNFGV